MPPFEDAMQTIAPIESAVTKNAEPVHPTARNIKQVRSNVATVIPEIGFDDEPISPVRRDETVTKRKPKATIMNAPRMAVSALSCSPNCGNRIIAAIKAMMPMRTNFIERSRSVLGAAPLAACPPRKSCMPPFKPCQIVGKLRMRLMMPPAATAPAPM